MMQEQVVQVDLEAEAQVEMLVLQLVVLQQHLILEVEEVVQVVEEVQEALHLEPEDQV